MPKLRSVFAVVEVGHSRVVAGKLTRNLVKHWKQTSLELVKVVTELLISFILAPEGNLHLSNQERSPALEVDENVASTFVEFDFDSDDFVLGVRSECLVDTPHVSFASDALAADEIQDVAGHQVDVRLDLLRGVAVSNRV